LVFLQNYLFSGVVVEEEVLPLTGSVVVEVEVVLPLTGSVKSETRTNPYSDSALRFIRRYMVGIDAHLTAKVFRFDIVPQILSLFANTRVLSSTVEICVFVDPWDCGYLFSAVLFM
jgi:hypothetical protein